MREYRARRPEATRAQLLKDARLHNARHPEKKAARYALTLAVKRGQIVPPRRCEDCRQSVPVEAHHRDYTKPLEVAWLCRPCHRQRHFLSAA